VNNEVDFVFKTRENVGVAMVRGLWGDPRHVLQQTTTRRSPLRTDLCSAPFQRPPQDVRLRPAHKERP
jgi:hypothetical protein